ncbi:MAG: cobalt-precorrin-5B (C(1))-methyltransferase, partial [Paracoccaceae bacterium]
IIKDAGDDPDVTHGCEVRARVRVAGTGTGTGTGVRFVGAEGVGTVTRPGLPIAPGEPAINPVPRRMMTEIVEELAVKYQRTGGVEITISIPGGAEIARKTWNPRLGITGGLSILGTTGIVRPFSCAAWIASIHRGIDVARAAGLGHVAGATGATSERAVQALYGLADHAMLDMGDFAGGLLKYLRRHPVAHVTIGGGIGKLTKLAQGAVDLHSARSQIDFSALSAAAAKAGVGAGVGALPKVNTALEAYEIAGKPLADIIAKRALEQVCGLLRGAPVGADIVMIDRSGAIIARAGQAPGGDK